jgi:hypothetical protein
MKICFLHKLLALVTLFISLHGEGEKTAPPKHSILVGSPIRQKPAILREFLASLERLDQTLYELSYFFVDDNEIEESKAILKQFETNHTARCHLHHPLQNDEKYLCEDGNHRWTTSLISKVADFKDIMIEHARDKQYDYLFLIDSDLVLHPKTIDQLILANKDIISNIFWTRWPNSNVILPQVWMYDQYTQYEKDPSEKLSDKEVEQRRISFLLKMRTPGVHEVGGLGACTLISQHALSKDINFKPIKNISFWGEDRHFCIRAMAL